MRRRQTILNLGRLPVRRLGRRALWAHPNLYRWFGILRGRGDCTANGFDVWVGGYPRSANSFVTAALRLGNPELKVVTHWHIHAFIIHAARSKKPGILLVRQPIDAVLSWAIFWEGRTDTQEALDYYLDFHRALVPYRKDLFIASFDDAIGHFDGLLQRFNSKFRTQYVAAAPNDELLDRCVPYVEDWFKATDGSVSEFTVPRPSTKRAGLKAKLWDKLHHCPVLSRSMTMAENLYKAFLPE